MPRPRAVQPTEGELAILRVLWARGPSTVHEVHAELGKQRPRRAPQGYTTVLKLLQVMLDKGLVVRDAGPRRHVYSAAQSRQHTQRRLVGRLMDQAFDGSAARLVQGALGARPASAEELAAIRKLLDEHERGGP